MRDPCLEGREHDARQAIWLGSRSDHHSCGTAPGSHRTSLRASPARRPTRGRYQGSRGLRSASGGQDRRSRPRPSAARSPASRTPPAPARGRRPPSPRPAPGRPAARRSAAASPLSNAAGSAGVVVHQQAGPAVVDDLRDPADVAGHDRGAAGGGLEVDDAQRLVDRGDDEHRGPGDQRHELLARQHLLDPDHAAAPGLQLRDRVGDLLPLAGGVRRRRRRGPGRPPAAAGRRRPAGGRRPSAG